MGRPRKLFATKGQQFNRLTVVNPEVRKITPGKPNGVPAARCRCACGKRVTVPLSALVSGDIKSCGCLKGEMLAAWLSEGGRRAELIERNRTPEAREAARQRGQSPENIEHLRRIAQLPKTARALRRWRRSPKNRERLRRIMQDPDHLQRMSQLAQTPEWQQRSIRSPEAIAKIQEFNRQRLTTHGLARHPLYQTWSGMIRRCEDPTSKSYRNYGGRGIAVCAEWHDVSAFIAWIETNLGPRADGMTLDRIDNNGAYEPGNVKWSTWPEQHANKRRMLGSLQELVDVPDSAMWCPTCGEQVNGERAFDRHYAKMHKRVTA